MSKSDGLTVDDMIAAANAYHPSRYQAEAAAIEHCCPTHHQRPMSRWCPTCQAHVADTDDGQWWPEGVA